MIFQTEYEALWVVLSTLKDQELLSMSRSGSGFWRMEDKNVAQSRRKGKSQ